MADRPIFRSWWLPLSWVPTTIGALQRRGLEPSLAQRRSDQSVPKLVTRQEVTSTFLP